ncbi:very short patch repair endonuclease [Bosea psychrotolerans]|uniref:Very short patch repair endonuclease n=1 Tax=Bosea psychrotolerans TaxID=1871628 RepID=A0A2S4LT29_9HYPH|nr:very short patch repair endonuclease [Bosea psychrotolerans]POR45555.1 T/G mismatch-specific endonuclease [Bosea psychrotolerans]
MTTKSKAVRGGPTRSQIMRAVRSKDTTPEMIVRRLVHGMGYRYRLHRKELPGNPDLVFPGRRKIVFVNGCFWHGHGCLRGARQPKANADYWRAKIGRNVKRDCGNLQALESAGWQVLTVWECETPKTRRDALEEKLQSFLM